MTKGIAAAAVLAWATEFCLGGTFLVSQRNAQTAWEWNSATGETEVFHSTVLNDVDVNPGQGSDYGWIVNHFDDYFGRFEVGSGNGLNARYNLGEGGRQHYHYPKHVTVFNGELIVSSRNDATIWRYDFDGNQIGSIATGNGIGQGMATDGSHLYVSFWDGGKSFFQEYDADFNHVDTHANPSGMGNLTNIVDFAHDAASGRFFGLATDFEQGTVIETRTVLEFTMGGSVAAEYTLPFGADGIGQSGGGCGGDEVIAKAKCKTKGGAVKNAVVKGKNGLPGQQYVVTLDTGESISAVANDRGKFKAKFRRDDAPPCGPNGASVCGQHAEFGCDCE